jgi:hypothetical protein
MNQATRLKPPFERVQVFEVGARPVCWRVEAFDDGGMDVNIFSGGDANEYAAAWRYGFTYELSPQTDKEEPPGFV